MIVVIPPSFISAYTAIREKSGPRIRYPGLDPGPAWQLKQVVALFCHSGEDRNPEANRLVSNLGAAYNKRIITITFKISL